MQSPGGIPGGGGQAQAPAIYQTFFSFFGLRENPFRTNPDPRYLFRSRRILQALNELEIGVQGGKALIVLTGEAGTGKTTLINHLLASLRMQEIPVAFVFNSHLDIDNLFDFMLADYGIKYNPRQNPNLRMLLNKCLLENHQAGRTPVLIVDEAQGLAAPVLEEIRMLLNLEAGGEALVRIVLAGQPELDLKLNRPEFRHLRQRIMLRCKTAPLSVEETHGYVRQRLTTAGSPDGAAFSSAAMDAIHFYSGGIPRVMNLLCEHSLINAYSDGVRPVTPEIVEEVAREFRFDDFRPLPASLTTDRQQTAAEVIPIQSSAAKMRMSAMAAREKSDTPEPISDTGLVSELIGQSPPPSVPVSAESLTRPMAAAASAAGGAQSRAHGPEPMATKPIAAAAPNPASVAGKDVRLPVSSPARKPAPISPLAARISRLASARLETSLTRMKHKLDDTKVLAKLHRLADHSLHWLRQPMRASHPQRILARTPPKSSRPGQNAAR